ncbi:MAG: hypothetical protein SWH68_11760 [Thermodesulfobacteriota bacterium]|nr:hypothetical protein [Thermodesulfobacteriota bacterium]
MTTQPAPNDWVFVVVHTTDGRDVFLGYSDEAAGISYIPAFYTKEDAHDCFLNLPREPGGKYEIQAVFFKELAEDALANHFLIFILDSSGRIRLKIDPATIVD